jgi:hypothetical protein
MALRGRPKKITEDNISNTLICPVCGKRFLPGDDSKYLIGKEYTCSWECFLNKVKEKYENDRFASTDVKRDNKESRPSTITGDV